MNKKIRLISGLVIIGSLVLGTSVYAKALPKSGNAKAKVQELVESGNAKVKIQELLDKYNEESKLQNRSDEERAKAGREFKENMKKLSEEAAKEGLEPEADKTALLRSIEANKDVMKSAIRGYEGKEYSKNAEAKKDCEILKKKVEFLNSLQNEYTSGNISAKDGLVKFQQIKDIK
jgi:hypothetical protein